MKTNVATLTPELAHKIDAYGRAADGSEHGVLAINARLLKWK